MSTMADEPNHHSVIKPANTFAPGGSCAGTHDASGGIPSIRYGRRTSDVAGGQLFSRSGNNRVLNGVRACPRRGTPRHPQVPPAATSVAGPYPRLSFGAQRRISSGMAANALELGLFCAGSRRDGVFACAVLPVSAFHRSRCSFPVPGEILRCARDDSPGLVAEPTGRFPKLFDSHPSL